MPRQSHDTHSLPLLPITAFNLHKLLGIPSPPYPPTHRHFSYKHTHTNGHFHYVIVQAMRYFFTPHLCSRWLVLGYFSEVCARACACACVCGTWWINDCSALLNAGPSWVENALSQQRQNKLHLLLYYYCSMWQANNLTQKENASRDTILKKIDSSLQNHNLDFTLVMLHRVLAIFSRRMSFWIKLSIDRKSTFIVSLCCYFTIKLIGQYFHD